LRAQPAPATRAAITATAQPVATAQRAPVSETMNSADATTTAAQAARDSARSPAPSIVMP
jgi:hypothetical protein